MPWSDWGSLTLPATLRSALKAASCCSCEQRVWAQVWWTRWRLLWRRPSPLPHGLTYRCSPLSLPINTAVTSDGQYLNHWGFSCSPLYYCSPFCPAACQGRTWRCWSTKQWEMPMFIHLPECWEAQLSSVRGLSPVASLCSMRACSIRPRRYGTKKFLSTDFIRAPHFFLACDVFTQEVKNNPVFLISEEDVKQSSMLTESSAPSKKEKREVERRKKAAGWWNLLHWLSSVEIVMPWL